MVLEIGLRGRTIWEEDRGWWQGKRRCGGEYDQSTLYTCMKMS
jgi:hypothetical protein